MKRIAWLLVVYAVIAVVVGCGKKSETTDTSSAPPAAPPAAPAATTDTASSATAAVSKYDSGPRANATPVDAAKAATGAKLFTTKGCVVCHGFGKKVTCPDLVPVAGQRTAEWMKNQIMHPDVMTHEDPTSKALFAQYKTQMPNQHLSDEVAGQLLEYLKQRNKAGK